MILVNSNTDLLLFLFCPFVKSKIKNQIFSKLAVWDREIFLFFVSVKSRSTSEAFRPNSIDFQPTLRQEIFAAF